MSKNKNINFGEIGGIFTKNAVEEFEKNIVNQTDYLEKIKNNIENKEIK